MLGVTIERSDVHNTHMCYIWLIIYQQHICCFDWSFYACTICVTFFVLFFPLNSQQKSTEHFQTKPVIIIFYVNIFGVIKYRMVKRMIIQPERDGIITKIRLQDPLHLELDAFPSSPLPINSDHY